jgi:hypothetical protein
MLATSEHYAAMFDAAASGDYPDPDDNEVDRQRFMGRP